jgi:hypothetical protein
LGNWRCVNIEGTMSAAHAAALRNLLDTGPDYEWDGWSEPYACLGFNVARPGLCGLGAWPAATMSRCGNLAERGFTVEDVAGALTALLPVAPTMLLKVHCGGDYESETCIATVSVGEGLVVIGKPEREKITPPSQEQMAANLVMNLMRP